MKVFITGVAGFLGSHLADKFISEGHTVIGCDNFIGGELCNIPEEVIFYTADCVDFDMMKKITEGCNYVYHCAASAYEGLSSFSPTHINRNTYLTTISVLSASIHNKVDRFIYLSSMARYGNIKSPFVEQTFCNPCDSYGIAKYAAELQVRNLCETHGTEYVIAVPHNIIGPRQKYDDPYRNVVSIFINKMLQGESPYIYGDGTQKRCFSFVDDCVAPLFEMSVRDVNKEIINIGPDEEDNFVSINELYSMVADKLKFKGNPIYVGDRPNEVPIAHCSSDKARKLLGYKTSTNLSQGIDDMIEYIVLNGIKKFDYHIPIEIESDLLPSSWKEQLI